MAYVESTRIVKNENINTSAGEVEKSNVSLSTVVRADRNIVAKNIVYFVYWLLAGTLGIRVLLSFFAANRSNDFASFIYSITGPFVAPFRSLFGVNTTLNDSGARFEIESAVAIVVYGLVAWGIASILTIRRDSNVIN